MLNMKTVDVPATTKEVVESVTCDICGAETNKPGYDIDETTINYRYGERYPEGGSWSEVVVDLCGKCFEEKLIPWLKSQGATPRETTGGY